MHSFRLELEDSLRYEQIFQTMRPEILEADSCRQILAEDSSRRLGYDHLAAMRRRADAGSFVDVKPDVAVANDYRIAGMYTHANADGQFLWPCRLGERSLRVTCRSHGVGRPAETYEKGIALRIDLAASVALKRLPKESPVLSEGLGIPVAERMEKLGRTLDIGEKEGYDPGRQAHEIPLCTAPEVGSTMTLGPTCKIRGSRMTPNGLRGRVIHEIVENSSLLVPFVPAPESLGAERRADHTWRVRCAKPLVNG